MALARRCPLRGIPPAERTLPALLRRQAEAFADRALIRCGRHELSYSDACAMAATAAGRLRAVGVQPGDRVAALCANRLELLELILGCAWSGAIVVPLNTALKGAQLEHVLSNSDARLLVADGALLPRVDHVDPSAVPEQIWALDDAAVDSVAGRDVRSAIAAGGPAMWRSAAPHPTGEPLPPHQVHPGDTAAILYTSGTTGPSKGVCCPQAQLYWWGVLVSELLAIEEGDVLYTCLPLFHTNALTAFVQALVSGATFVLGERFSASRFWTCASAAGADVTYLLGAMVSILMGREPDPAERGHHVRVALAPATPSWLFDRFRDRFGVRLVEGYGSTETNNAIGPEHPTVGRAGYMGPVRPGFAARVVDDDDEPVSDGSAGELLLRHEEPFAFATGYYRMPEQTLEAWRNLWFHTGDRVVRESDGWYRFLDRAKDAIRRRGENISSWEVEQVLVEHECVQAAAAFPVPSELSEDEVMAAIVLEPGAMVSAEDLIRHCGPRLAYFAIPRYIDFVGELPLTENGKVRKQVLRERGVTDTTWDREARPAPR
jgi:crotonobetaine/carnitine-CoA ligase